MRDEYEVRLTDYLMVLWREKWIVLLTFVVAVGTAFAITLQQAPQYEAETSLLITPPLARDVAGELVGTVYSPGTYRRFALAGDLLERAIAKAYPDGNGPQPAELRQQMSIDVEEGTARDFPGRFPLYLRATFQGSSPEALVNLAAAWAEAFVEQNEELFLTRTAQAFTYVSATFADVEEELLALEEALKLHRQAYPETLLSTEITALETVYKAQVETLAESKRALLVAQAELSSLQKALAEEPERFTLERGPSAEALWGFLGTQPSPSDTGAFAELTIREEVLNENHRALREQVVNAKSAVASLTEDVAYLEASLDETRRSLEVTQAELVEAQTGRERLEREVSVLSDTYARVGEKLQDARLARAEAAEPIRVVEAPVVPTRAIGPDRRMNIAVAGVLGLFVGILLAFVAHSVKSHRALEEQVTNGSGAQRSDPPDGKNPHQPTDHPGSQQES